MENIQHCCGCLPDMRDQPVQYQTKDYCEVLVVLKTRSDLLTYLTILEISLTKNNELIINNFCIHSKFFDDFHSLTSTHQLLLSLVLNSRQIKRAQKPAKGWRNCKTTKPIVSALITCVVKILFLTMTIVLMSLAKTRLWQKPGDKIWT